MLSVPASRYIVYPVPWYSFLIVLGVFLAVLLASGEERRLGLKKDTVIDLCLWLLPAGILGARVYYVLFSWDQYRSDFWSVFRIWEGGIAIYGAVIAGVIVILLFARHRKVSPLLLCDIIAPGLALAQGIGRWGNYFNMEAYGLQVVSPALCFFPLAVQIPENGVYTWHLATFFYESLWDLLIFLLLMVVRRKVPRKNGNVFFLYLFLYAAGRFVIEDLRMDSLYASSSVRVSQLLSALACLGVLLYIRLSSEKAHTPLPLLVPAACVLSACQIVYALFPSLLAALPAYRRVLLLSLSALLLIVCFIPLYLSYAQGVQNADHKT